ncbi:BspA family leucine-rich repeat surface protein, partial [Flavobacteriaceae bacterium S0825]|uniref:HYR-like domain-containing protein n=1 Tax=Gaetbulibacter sp. S0825 TaxID=2720084 RepID=UPI00143164A2
GNEYDFKQEFSGEDNTAPELIGTIPSDMSDLDACIDSYEGPSEQEIAALFHEECGLSVVKTTHRTGSNCGNGWINSFEYTVSDACGNSYPTFKIIYQGSDQSAPVWGQEVHDKKTIQLFTEDGADCPSDATTSLSVGDKLNINSTFSVAGTQQEFYAALYQEIFNAPLLYDNCTATNDIVIEVANVTKSGGGCYAELSIDFVAHDLCGNTSSIYTKYFTISDNTAPVIAAAPQDISVQCIEDVPAMISLDWTDNCQIGGSIQGVDGELVGGECGGTITRTWNVKDACGNEAITRTQIITVKDTIIPVLEAAPQDITVQCIEDVPAMISLAWTDNCDAGGSVEGVDTDLVGGECGGTITRTWNIKDTCGNEAVTRTQVITVNDTTKPVITFTPADVTIECDESTDPSNTGGTATATDNCATPTVTFNDEESTNNGGGEETLLFEDFEDVTITYTPSIADDIDELGTSDYFGRVNNVDLPSSINYSNVQGNSFYTAHDTDGTSSGNIDNLQLNWTGIDITDVSNLKLAIKLAEDDSSDGAEDWDTTSSVKLQVQIDGGGYNSILAVESELGTDGNETNEKPRLDTDFNGVGDGTEITDAFAEFISNISGTGTSLDIRITIVFLDSGDEDIAIDDVKLTGERAASLCTDKVITRTWKATDDCGNTITSVQKITVKDTTAPVLAAAPVNVSVQCIEDVPAMISLGYTDNCDADGTVEGVDSALEGTDCNGTITRTWNITDACGNVAETRTQIITIKDSTNPTASNPADINVECEADVPTPDVTVVTDEDDNCSTPTVTWVKDESDNGSCPETITRTYKVEDACGNSIEVQQKIIIKDETPPTLVVPQDITVQCNAVPPPPSVSSLKAQATDNCDDDVQVIYQGETEPESLGCANSYKFKRYWRAIDACGNITNKEQEITVIDTTKPVLASAPKAVTVSCLADVPTMVSLGWTDNCDTGGSVEGVDGDLVGDACNGTITRTWNITDACGNVAETRTQIITIKDSINPTASNPADINVECEADVPTPDVTVVTDEDDNCSTPTVTWVKDESDNGSCPETITRTYKVEDACGNSIEVTQKIIIKDVTKPILASAPKAVIVSCLADVPDMISLGYTDNCDADGTVEGVDSALEGTDCNGTITRTWNITDACGNVAETRTQIITIKDSTNPTASNPADINVECEADVPTPDVTVVTDEDDNCSTPTVTWVKDESDNGSCPETITRTYKVEDACGNSIEVTQKIIIKDETKPVIVNCPDDVDFGEVTETPTFAEVADITATDNCDTDPLVTFVGDTDDSTYVPGTPSGNAPGSIYKFTCQTPGTPDFDFITFVWDGTTTVVGTSGPQANYTPVVNNMGTYTLTFEEGIDNPNTNPVESLNDWVLRLNGQLIALKNSQNNDEFPDCDANWIETDYLENTLNCKILRVDCIGDAAGPGVTNYMKIRSFKATDDCGNESDLCTVVYKWSIADSDEAAFITTWRTTSNNESITIPTNGSYTYNYHVDWGDGSTPTNETGDATHTYTTPGDYQVKITGVFQAIYFYNSTPANRSKIISIDNWGDIEWISMFRAFRDCENLDVLATDIPDLSNTTDMTDMFGSTALIGNASFKYWDVSSITKMGGVFRNTKFNQDISGWDVSSVTEIYSLFAINEFFNQDISGWDVSSVENMGLMFFNAKAFNQDISGWDVSSVKNMHWMFIDAVSFNQDIGNWDVSQVENMQYMFRGAISFDQDLGSWEISSLTNAELMFGGVTLSTANYDNLLQGWATDSSGIAGDGIDDVPTGITFSGGNSMYCAGETARNTLLAAPYNWTITDGGLDGSCPPPPSVNDGDKGTSDATMLDFKAYPVPFNQDVTLSYNFEFDTEVTVEVYDTKGLLVLSKKVAYKADVDATMPLRINGADQMYYVKLITNNGTVTKKILASKL